MASREYKLRSPGNPGGLVPLGAPSVPAAAEPEEIVLDHLPGTGKMVKATPAPARFAAGLPSTLPAAPPASALPASGTPVPGPRRKGGPPLSQPQKATLGSMSAAAFAALAASDPDWIADMKRAGHSKTALMEDWRHGQCAVATKDHPAGQIRGLSKAGNEHYNCLLAHFAALAGQDIKSMDATMRDTPATAAGDTADKMRQALWRLEQSMKKTGLGWPYVMAIVKRKHHATAVDQLTAGQIHQLCWTLNNRKNQKRHDAGEVATDGSYRNKAQTAARLEKKAAKRAGTLAPESPIKGDLPANVTAHNFTDRHPF